jgi:hypothetical protein
MADAHGCKERRFGKRGVRSSPSRQRAPSENTLRIDRFQSEKKKRKKEKKKKKLGIPWSGMMVRDMLLSDINGIPCT